MDHERGNETFGEITEILYLLMRKNIVNCFSLINLSCCLICPAVISKDMCIGNREFIRFTLCRMLNV